MPPTSSRPRRPQRSLWNKIWRDRRGQVVIWQTPNVWLIVWVVLTIISLFSSSHTTQKDFWWLSAAVLGIWALLEIFRGVNYFRRALGLFILFITIASAFGIGL